MSNIEEAYAGLSEAFDGGGELLLDVAALTDVDLTFVQLIEVARRQAAADGRTMTLRAPAGGPVLEVLQRGGFLDDAGSDRATFWLQGTMSQ